MINTIKYANVTKIFVENLKFYDAEKVLECVNFCNKNGITYLPSKDRKSVYELVNGSIFEQKPLNSIISIQPHNLLFDIDNTINKFKIDSDNVLFVIEKDLIIGVVHIADYQNEFIYFELYKLLYKFEIMVRQLLISKNEDNQTFIEYITQKSNSSDFYKTRLEEYSKGINERNAFGQFQTFYLNDLMTFSNSKKHFKFDTKAIGIIRNFIAHNKEIINQDKSDFNGKFYNIDGLVIFSDNINIFFNTYQKLENELNKI